MQFEFYKRQFVKWLKIIFSEVEIKEEGKLPLIPLSGNHITINGINIFFEDSSKQHYLSYNKYNQFSIERQEDNHTKTCVTWDSLEDITEIWITAPNQCGDINPKTNKVFYDLFVFKLL